MMLRFILIQIVLTLLAVGVNLPAQDKSFETNRVSITVTNQADLDLSLTVSQTSTNKVAGDRVERNIKPNQSIAFEIPKGQHVFDGGTYKNGKMVTGTASQGGVAWITNAEVWTFSLEQKPEYPGVRVWKREVKPAKK